MVADPHHFVTSPAYLKLFNCCLMAAVLSGCGHTPHSDKPSGKVVATVTYDDKPVTNASLNLSNSQTGLGGGGPLDSNGTITINAVPVGDYVVTVTPPPPPASDPNPQQIEYPQLPDKFRSQATSTLKATVTEGDNELKIELKE